MSQRPGFHSPEVEAKMREGLGKVMSTPVVAGYLSDWEELDFSAACDALLVKTFDENVRNTAVVAKEKVKVSRIFAILAKHVYPEGPVVWKGDGRQSKSRNIGKQYADCCAVVKKALAEDMCLMFHMNVCREAALETRRIRGMNFLRSIQWLLGQSGLFGLFPNLMATALICTLQLGSTIRMYSKETDRRSLFKDMFQDLLHVWLQEFGGAVASKDENGEMPVPDWVATILSWKEVVFTIIQYIPEELIFRENPDAASQAEYSLCTYTFDNVDFGDMSRMLAVIEAVTRDGDGFMGVFDRRKVGGRNCWKGAKEAVRKLRMDVEVMAGDAGPESCVTHMRSMLRNFAHLLSVSAMIGEELDIPLCQRHQLSCRSGRFSRDELYELTGHVLADVSVAMFFRTSLMSDCYGGLMATELSRAVRKLLN